MREIRITITTENDAFHPAPELEVARILRNLASDLCRQQCPENLMDRNGNGVGVCTVQYQDD